MIAPEGNMLSAKAISRCKNITEFTKKEDFSTGLKILDLYFSETSLIF